MVAAYRRVVVVDLCGTISGYTLHCQRDEPKCDACKAAVAQYAKQRRRDCGIGPPGVVTCGTYSGYVAHYKRGDEEPCRPCSDARNVYQKQWRRLTKLRQRRGKITDVITDYAETYRPVSISELVLLIRLRHDLKPATIKRTVYKMLHDGRLTGDDVVT